MTSSLSRAALSLWVLGGLATGCASRQQSGETANPPMRTAGDIALNTGEPIEQVLQAKDPGIMVSRAPNGDIALSIRGSSSFYGGTQPLFVIDGVPMESGPGGTLTGLNPHDIQSIKVLKNPSDIGVYGMRGANGVIVISMRKPGQRS